MSEAASIIRARLPLPVDDERVAINVFLDPEVKTKFTALCKRTGWTQAETIAVAVDVTNAVLDEEGLP